MPARPPSSLPAPPVPQFSLLCGGGADFHEQLARDGLDGSAHPPAQPMGARRPSPASSADDAAPRYVRTRGDVLRERPSCTDSPGWRSGALDVAAPTADRHRAASGLSCAQYEELGYCADGHLLAPFYKATGGAAHNSPHEHCCACGKAERDAASAEARALGAEKGGVRDLSYPLPGEPAFSLLPRAQQACSHAQRLRSMGAKAAAAEELLRACDLFFALPTKDTALAQAEALALARARAPQPPTPVLSLIHI